MKKILAVVSILLFSFVGNVFADDCQWFQEVTGCRYGRCKGVDREPRGPYCVRCCRADNICTAVDCANDLPNTAPTVNTAQVESRGEFYFLTKDGRKVSGAEADKIPLEEGTKVVTGNDGHVKMTLPDNTTFTVGPNSDLVIDKFVYDADKTPGQIMATMTKGVFRWITGKTAQHDPAKMKVTLPVVAVGIRGTDFEATVVPDGSGSVVLNFGQLEVTEKKTGFTFILNAGEKITFGADGSVSRPVKVN